MSRSTREDEAFKRQVAREFLRARDRALEKGFSMERFVQSLGVTRAGFHKYVTRQSIPSLRVLKRARKYWGVHLSYTELGARFVGASKEDPRQMKLQLSLENISKEQIEVKRFSASGEKAVELVIRINFSKSA